jgi:hypothetical protein
MHDETANAFHHPALLILSGLRAAFPSLDDELRCCQRNVTRKLTLSPIQQQRIILEALDAGCSTVEDLMDETGFTRPQVRAALDELIRDRILEERQQGGKTDDARGPRRLLYFRSGTPSGDLFTAPAPAQSTMAAMAASVFAEPETSAASPSLES